VQAEFVRGVALLHSFFYEEARRIFTAVSEKDPGCAMAYWGIAQTWWHPIWTPPTTEEASAGRAAAVHAASLPSTPRERGFIDAINAYYAAPEGDATAPVGQSCHGPVGGRGRVEAYAQAMRKLYERFPDDFETRVFYAFAVLSVGYATPLDTSLSNQKAAGTMLEKLWKENRRHPGAAHYLIHAYDYPALAERALPAAQAYASIAPWVPHALHMPSHIFTRLGMWDESVASNQASAQASRAHAAELHRAATEVEELHALDYMMYSYLQEARDVQARRVLDAVSAVEETYPALDFTGAYAMAAMPVRFALERGAWKEAAALPIPARPQWARYPFVAAMFEYAHALGRARTGDLDGARAALDTMRAARDATTEPRFDYFRRHLDLQIRTASAWIDRAEGRGAEAAAALRGVADAEDALGKHPVSPGALVPAREQLGDMLLELDRPKEALQAYDAALRIYPARFCGLYGSARAAEKMGDSRLARRGYEKLAKQTAGAESTRAELTHAREYLQLAATSKGPARSGS
jgi:tetratricopeptide (TPR) repeat protein